MTHNHTSSQSSQVSVKGCPVLVEQCACGAKRRPNGQPPTHERTMLLGGGWYSIRPDYDALRLLNNEGYASERDACDLLDSHDPRNAD